MRVSVYVVGQVGNLRPIVNRPPRGVEIGPPGGLPTRRRLPTCPTGGQVLSLYSGRLVWLARRRKKPAKSRLQARLPAPRSRQKDQYRKTRSYWDAILITS